MKRILLIILLCKLNFHFLICQYAEQPKWDDSLNLEMIESQLLNTPILKKEWKWKTKDIYHKSMHVYLITLSNDLKAIFKTRNIQNYAEVAAYRISKYLNQRLVPPTILRTIDNVEGSLQFFVTSSNQTLNNLPQKTLSDAILFSFIFGRIDGFAHGENFIIQKNQTTNIALIDNATILSLQKGKYGNSLFFRYSPVKNPKINNYSSFPFHLAKPFSILESKYYNIPTTSWTKSYVIYKDHIWFQPDPKIFKPCFTNIYSKSTIEAYKNLNKQILMDIWNLDNSPYSSQKPLLEEIIDEVIDRKEQVLQAAKKGILIN